MSAAEGCDNAVCSSCPVCAERAREALRVARQVQADDASRLRRFELLERRVDEQARGERGTFIGERIARLEGDVEAQARALTAARDTVGMRLQEAVRATWRAWLRVLA